MVSIDGSPLPTASVSLTLNDEVQYRCAGYIQAEIERYAESLDEEAEGGEEDGDSDKNDSSDAEGEDKPTGKKAKAGNRLMQPAKDGQRCLIVVGRHRLYLSLVDLNFRARLEKEYLFIDIMSTFLRAIRAGAIHIRHGAVLLAHYGRLGPAFDVCSKVIVEVLREEGMINDNGEVVVTVLAQALQEVWTRLSPTSSVA